MNTQGVKNNLIINRGNSLILCDREHQKDSFNVAQGTRILVRCQCIPQTAVEAARGCTVRNMQILMFISIMEIM